MQQKHPSHSDRKEALIMAAAELFVERGYDQTTIEAIIERVGASKGGFYHHFQSKSDVLDAVVEKMTHQWTAYLEQRLAAPGLGAVERLNLFFKTSAQWSRERIWIIDKLLVLYRDENLLIRHKLEQLGVEASLPMLTQIIKQGNAQGVFDAPQPDETARIILLLANSLRALQSRDLARIDQQPELIEQVEQRVALGLQMMERMLAAPAGSIEPVGRELLY
ncbi:MAG: TetR/AcrR family transcriptional regulator [Candidatus Alcyoniella australis]|nr:TetR/AcrR family transcriptional regulator [Candidatus Alcyoniella australis]